MGGSCSYIFTESGTLFDRKSIRVTDDLSPLAYTPIPVPDVPDEYIISSEAVEHALSVINERKSVGP